MPGECLCKRLCLESYYYFELEAYSAHNTSNCVSGRIKAKKRRNIKIENCSTEVDLHNDFRNRSTAKAGKKRNEETEKKRRTCSNMTFWDLRFHHVSKSFRRDWKRHRYSFSYITLFCSYFARILCLHLPLSRYALLLELHYCICSASRRTGSHTVPRRS